MWRKIVPYESYGMNHAGYVLKFLKRKHKQSQAWWTLWSIFEWETLRNESSRYSSHPGHWKNDTETISITAEKACFSFQIWIYRLLWCKKYPSRNACFLWNKKNCWFRQNIFLIIFWSSGVNPVKTGGNIKRPHQQFIAKTVWFILYQDALVPLPNSGVQNIGNASKESQ